MGIYKGKGDLIMTVRALLSTARGFANAVNRQAVKNKNFAQELVFNHGIRGEITPKSLQGITKDMFDSAGRLTQKGEAEIQRVISETGLSQNATWDQILEAVGKQKEQIAKRIECELNKLKDTLAIADKKIITLDIEKFREAVKNGFKKYIPVDPKYAHKLNKLKLMDCFAGNAGTGRKDFATEVSKELKKFFASDVKKISTLDKSQVIGKFNELKAFEEKLPK